MRTAPRDRSRATNPSRVAFPLALTLVLCACNTWNGGSTFIPPRQPVWRSQHRAAPFKVGQPGSEWAPFHDEGTQVAWKHRSLPLAIQVRGQCEEHGDSDLESFTDHLRIDFNEWKVVESRYITLVQRDAMRSTIDAELDGVAVRLELIVLKKDGCLFDFDLVGPPQYYDSGLPHFEEVVAGFRFPIGRG